MRSRTRANAGPLPTCAVVSEQPDVRRHILTLLSAHEWEVKSYESAAAVLGNPRTLQTDLLLVSESLPDLRGPNLVHELRRNGWRGRAILVCSCPGTDLEPYCPSPDFVAMFDPSRASHLLIELVEAQIA